MSLSSHNGASFRSTIGGGQEDQSRFEALIRRAQKGDSSAFGDLYEAYLTPIFRFILLRVKNKADAEELTQITFLKAWNGMRGYTHQGRPFTSWLYTIARNTVIDHWKKKKEAHIESNEEYFYELRDHVATPHEASETRERDAALRGMMDSLSPDQQEIITLKFINDLSNKEIAEITGKTEDAIRQLQFRALKILREKLKHTDAL